MRLGKANRIVSALALGAAMTAAVATTPETANAALMVQATVGGAPTGVSYVSFDSLSLGNAGGVSNGITVSYTGTGRTVQGAASGLYAAPFLSNSNGVPFGIAGNGADPTRYLSTGIGSVVMVLPGDMKYFGLLWGSVDNYNTLEFWNDGVLIGSLTGTDIWAGANGDQGANGTFYVNVNSTQVFDKVVAKSSQYAFELDNVAYNTQSTVPEPATWTLLIAALLSLSWMVRRRRASVRA